MKYISITTSANFGNMISMAVASLFLPFLPLLAKQILLNNFLSDLPSLAIATDNVDAEQTARPRHWDIGFVRRFMISFGLVSSLFDFATFGFLLFVVACDAATFQTGWFVESLITELAIVLIVRTHKAFWTSRPSPLLAWLTLAVGVVAIVIPYLPFAAWFGFVPLPLPVLAGLVAITALYVLASEAETLVLRCERPHGRGGARAVAAPCPEAAADAHGDRSRTGELGTPSGDEHRGTAEATGAQVVERLVGAIERIGRGEAANTCLAGQGEELPGIGAGQIGDRHQLAFLPQERIGHGRDVAHVNAATDHAAALADGTQGRRHERPTGRR